MPAGLGYDPAQKGAGIHFAQPLSLSLPACLQVCGQFVQDTHLSLWFPVSLQVSVPRDLAVSVRGSPGTSGGSDWSEHRA